MRIKDVFKPLSILALFVLSIPLAGQSLKQEKMTQLSFLVGEWIGTSSSYENGVKTKEIPAFEKISYGLDKHILIVQLSSESLQLHTIIYYDEQDSTYYYNPFSKRGARKLPADLVDGELVVRNGTDTRYVFGSPSEGQFREYGERLVDGEWVKYFEDNFRNVE